MYEESLLLPLPAGWAGAASAFPSSSELCEQTGNRESDWKCCPTFGAWVDIYSPLCCRKKTPAFFSVCEGFPVELDGGRVLCEVLVMEDVDSGTIAIRIKPGRIRGQRRALWVETALPLLRKNQEASRSTAIAKGCQWNWNLLGKLIFCVHSDACSGRMLMLQGCAYVFFTPKLCVQWSASFTFSSCSSHPATSSGPCIPPQQTQRWHRHWSIFLSF